MKSLLALKKLRAWGKNDKTINPMLLVFSQSKALVYNYNFKNTLCINKMKKATFFITKKYSI